MRWRGRRGSLNIDDRRGPAGRRGGVRLGGFGLIAVVVIGLLLGVDPATLLNIAGGGGVQAPAPAPAPAPATATSRANDEMKAFVSVVLADTEEVWTEVLREQFRQGYKPPTLVLFSGHTTSGCGGASAATGPFYCPADQRIFLDMGFFDQLEHKLGAGGDFARAYVIAHEVAHHVQNELGILQEANRRRASVDSEEEANDLSVRLELQADCFAGVWAYRAEAALGILEPGDIEEALNAASSVGDDVLQKRQQGYAVPDSFTHGSAEQRMRWFARGYEGGNPDACGAFEAGQL